MGGVLPALLICCGGLVPSSFLVSYEINEAPTTHIQQCMVATSAGVGLFPTRAPLRAFWVERWEEGERGPTSDSILQPTPQTLQQYSVANLLVLRLPCKGMP